MNARLVCTWTRITAVALLLAWINAATGQTFSSGSTGADGPLNLASGTQQTITVRPGGVYNYTTVTIGINATLNFVRGADNSPVVILATGNVDIQSGGVISVNGSSGIGSGVPVAGGAGGPGGFNGGANGRSGFAPTAGEGPAGGQPIATGGGNGGAYGSPTSFVGLVPLFGGSGGAGSTGTTIGGAPSGGGGGGAVLIASSTKITINGSIRANGGSFIQISGCLTSGSGSGGAIRLVAPEIAGSTAGLVQALGGPAAPGSGCEFSAGGNGRIRMEASIFSGFLGQTNPVPSIANAPGPVSGAGNPALVNVPTLTISSIGGLTVPATPTGSYSVPDLALAPGTANPIQVVLNATNTPVGSPTVITVRLISRTSPGTASNVTVPATDHTGTFASSSATANVTLPTGQVSLLLAFATMTLTGQTASLFPLIDGEPVERVMVAASPGQPSTVSLITKSGKEVRVDELRDQDRVRIALAWEVLRAARTE